MRDAGGSRRSVRRFPHPDLPWSKGEKMGCSLEEEQLRRKEGYLALTVL